MSKTSTTRSKRRAVTDKRHRGWHDRAVKALVGVSTICAMVGVGFLALPGSEAATTKQATSKAKAAAAECSTFAHTGIPGVVINETNDHLKRTFVEHGPGTGFFKPEPPAEIPAKTVSPWCVGSHFGVEAMKVDYHLPDGAKAQFQAFYAAVVGSLETSCSTSSHRYGCAAEKVGPNFVCSPYVGCVGPLRDKNALKGVDVVFRVFPR
jgi:hypothetical protein